MATLRAAGISVHYGGVRALVDVDLELPPGQLVGLIGPNGAGKTTFIDAVTGFIPGAEGSVSLDREDITRMRPEQRARAGLARTWQAADLFDDLTVRENLAVSAARPSPARLLREIFTGTATADPAVDEALERIGIGHLAECLPDELTHGQRKLVGVARALASSPGVICLDEPAAGLDSEESRELGRHLRKIVEGGVAMMLVDHDMNLVLGVCDHVVVLNFGEVIARGGPDAVRRDPGVVAAYLGGASEDLVETVESADVSTLEDPK